MTDFLIRRLLGECQNGYSIHSADNTRRDISGVKDILTQLSTISRDSYQEWIEYLRCYYSSFDLLQTGRRCRFIVARDARGK